MDNINVYIQATDDQLSRHVNNGIANLEAYKLGFEHGKEGGLIT